jgi:hypothetical protein
MFNAASANCSSQQCDMAQPTTALEYKSRMTATESHPCVVGIDVISVTHLVLGSVAVHSRCKTLGATGWVASRLGVSTRRCLRRAASSAFPIKRATRLRERLLRLLAQVSVDARTPIAALMLVKPLPNCLGEESLFSLALTGRAAAARLTSHFPRLRGLDT